MSIQSFRLNTGSGKPRKSCEQGALSVLEFTATTVLLEPRSKFVASPFHSQKAKSPRTKKEPAFKLPKYISLSPILHPFFNSLEASKPKPFNLSILFVQRKLNISFLERVAFHLHLFIERWPNPRDKRTINPKTMLTH